MVSLDFYRLQPDQIAQMLQDAGFAMFARLLREPDSTENVQQAYLLARKAATTGDFAS